MKYHEVVLMATPAFYTKSREGNGD